MSDVLREGEPVSQTFRSNPRDQGDLLFDTDGRQGPPGPPGQTGDSLDPPVDLTILFENALTP